MFLLPSKKEKRKFHFREERFKNRRNFFTCLVVYIIMFCKLCSSSFAIDKEQQPYRDIHKLAASRRLASVLKNCDTLKDKNPWV